MQEAAPLVEEYDPAPQGVQETAPLLEYVPAAQTTQVEEAVAPKTEENVPAAHNRQTAEPDAYVPGGQLVAVYKQAAAPVKEYVPAGHSVFTPPVQNEPASHALQVAALAVE